MIDRDFQPEELEFAISDATELFVMAPPADLISSSLSRPLSLEDFNQPCSPVFLAQADLRSWLIKNDFKIFDVRCDIPFDTQMRYFCLPPQISFLANPVRELIAASQAISSLDEVFALGLAAYNYFVPWDKAMLASSYHYDDDICYDVDDNRCEIPFGDVREHMFYIAASFPFTTQFHLGTSARNLHINGTEKYVGDTFQAPQPAQFYAWHTAQVHRSPCMPESNEKCLDLLKEEDPAIVQKIVRDDGVMRTFLRLDVGRYHPQRQNRLTM